MIKFRISHFVIAACLLQIFFAGNAAAPKKSAKTKIGETLTQTNALFPRSEVREAPAQTLFILLDDSESPNSEIGAITFNVLMNLYHKSGPLLVSGRLLHNIFSRPLDETKYRTTKEALLTEMSKNKKDVIFLESDAFDKQNITMSNFILNEVVATFDPEDWIIKLPISLKGWEQSLFLLIPKDYLEEGSIPSDPQDETLFKLNDMETINDSKQQWKTRFTGARTAGLSAQGFMDLITRNLLFVGRPSLSQSQSQWIIYLGGHGLRDKAVAGLSVKKEEGKQKSEFQELLHFLNTSILTKLFVYDSCQSTGLNRQQVYEESTRNVGAAYPFPIISAGTAEANTIGSMEARSLYRPSGKFLLDFFINPKKFAQLAESNQAIAYDELLPCIIDDIDRFTTTGPIYERTGGGSNFPLIRFPHRSLFLPVIPTAEITELIATTRDINKPMNIQEYAKQKIAQQFGVAVADLDFNPAVVTSKYFCVMLSAQKIPFKLQLIDKESSAINQHPPVIISTLSGTGPSDGVHIFNSIETNYKFDPASRVGFCPIFLEIRYAVAKNFFIRELAVKDKSEKATVYWNVVMRAGKEKKMYYTTTKETVTDGKKTLVEDKKYSSAYPSAPSEITEDYMKEYADAIDAVETRYKTGRQKIEKLEKSLAGTRSSPERAEKQAKGMEKAREAVEKEATGVQAG